MQGEQIDSILSASSDQLVVAGQYFFEKDPRLCLGAEESLS